MRTTILTAIITLVLTGATVAQGISATVTPNPALPGAQIAVVVTDAAGQGLTFTSSCIVKEVRAGSPSGPTVFSPWCLFVIQTVAPGGSITGYWDQTDDWGSQVADGVYFMKVRYQNTAMGVSNDEWFSVNITSDPAAPSLTVTPGSQAAVGQTLSLDLSAPAAGPSSYLVAASQTTNTGISLGSDYVHLDYDWMLELSVLYSQHPLFNNLQGNLDVTGFATGMGMDIPALPALQGMPLHMQALVVAPGGIELTNCVHLTVN